MKRKEEQSAIEETKSWKLVNARFFVFFFFPLPPPPLYSVSKKKSAWMKGKKRPERTESLSQLCFECLVGSWTRDLSLWVCAVWKEKKKRSSAGKHFSIFPFFFFWTSYEIHEATWTPKETPAHCSAQTQFVKLHFSFAFFFFSDTTDYTEKKKTQNTKLLKRWRSGERLSVTKAHATAVWTCFLWKEAATQAVVHKHHRDKKKKKREESVKKKKKRWQMEERKRASKKGRIHVAYLLQSLINKGNKEDKCVCVFFFFFLLCFLACLPRCFFS